jgi:nucleoside-diphosphate-sugar epimerase
MERWCLNRAKSSGSTRIVVLNPTCVYGPWGATYSELPAKLARGGAFGWLEGGNGNANYNFVSNLIDAILLASTCREAHGERFLINDGVVTWREFLEPLVTLWQQDIPSYTKDDLTRMEGDGRLSVRKAVRKLLTDPSVRAIFRQTAAGAAVTSIARRYLPGLIPSAARNGSSASSGDATMPAPHPPAWLADLFGNSSTVYSSEKAQRILGWHPKVDLREGQHRTRNHLAYLFCLPS